MLSQPEIQLRRGQLSPPAQQLRSGGSRHRSNIESDKAKRDTEAKLREGGEHKEDERGEGRFDESREEIDSLSPAVRLR